MIKVEMSVQKNRAPDPSNAPLLGRTAPAVVGKGVTILQLNIEGLTTAKLEVLSQLTKSNNTAVIMLQETHCTGPEKLKLPGFDLATFTPSSIHGIATFVKTGMDWTLESTSPPDSSIEWAALRIQGTTLVNVYKPPPCRLSTTSLPAFHSPCVYAGDFNCRHMEWGYSSNNPDGENLAEWAYLNNLTLLYNPRDPDSFLSGRWHTGTNPDLAFAGITPGEPSPDRRVLEIFPRSQHRPSLIHPASIAEPPPSNPVRRWNFKKANWKQYTTLTNKLVDGLPSPSDPDSNTTYAAFSEMLIYAAKRAIPRGCRKNYTPCWDQTSQDIYESLDNSDSPEELHERTERLMTHLNSRRQKRWIETVESIDFTHSSRKAWDTINRLTGRASRTCSKCPVTPNAIASQLVANGRYANPDRSFKRCLAKNVAELWKTDTESHDLTGDFTDSEMTNAIKSLKAGKSPGLDRIHPEFLQHMGKNAVKWLQSYFSLCLKHLKIPKIWRKALVVAIPKPNKPTNQPKSYRPISLLCVPFKLMERLIYRRLEPIIDPQLPQEQAGFRHGMSTVDQVTLLTQNIEDGFEANMKTGLVLLDLTAAYDTVWHKGLTYKLLQTIPARHMVKFILELITNRSFILKTSDGRKSRLRRLKNGVPQGSVLAPMLFNIYTHDLPSTTSRKYVYADDIAILYSHPKWKTVETTLSSDMDALSSYLSQWRLKLSEAKTTTAAFHLNNKEAGRQLRIKVNNQALPFSKVPTYLGVKLDRSLTYRTHLEHLRGKVQARTALLRRLAGTSWGANTRALRTSAVALVHAPAEYCAAAWGRSAHTKLVDVPINNCLRTITGCLQPTPTDSLPILAGIMPAQLRRQRAILSLSHRAERSGHLLHETISKTPPPQRLKSRKTFQRAAQDLLATSDGLSSRQWAYEKWEEDWSRSSSPLHRFIVAPSEDHPSKGLPRIAAIRLNRLLTGVGRFRANMQRWNLATSAQCECGEVQTAEHIISDCPLFSPPNGIDGLINLDEDTKRWLMNDHLQI